MPEYCEVALPVPLDQSFTYSVPPGIELRPGVRVLVPFGVRKLIGVVLRSKVSPKGLDPAAIKLILRAMDEDPVASEEFLRLSRWIADYYLVPQGEVLAAMLPLQSSVRQKSRVVLTDAGNQALAAAGDSAASGKPVSDEIQLLRRIAKRGGLRRESLRNVAPLVSKLKRKGWVRIEVSV